MRAKRKIAIIEDFRFRDHRSPAGHPERPDRLAAVSAAVSDWGKHLTHLTPRPATPDEILRVHGRSHYDAVAAAARRAPTQLDADTFVSIESFEVAQLAAGAAVDLTGRIARGEVSTGLAAVRPPGHHAESNRAMGFCLFNNIAIAARALQHDHDVDRILIVDWDVHHGNGTQHFFEADPSVLFASIHQFPFYPGTGDATESGVDAGEGFTLNIPLPAGCGDAEYLGVFQRLIAPAARAFAPEMILVSCGFDAHRDDPMGAMAVTGKGFGEMTAIVRSLADDLCEGRLAFVLEGGYAATGLREGTSAVFDALVADTSPATAPAASIDPGSVVERVVDRVLDVHGRQFQGLGAA